MGVKELWSILEPAKEIVKFDSLEGSKVAIDLGFWVCQMESAVSSYAVQNIYLRNLFFRLWNMLRRGLHVIVVADGRPPDLKQTTMVNRQALRHKQVGISSEGKTCKRSRFLSQLRQCIKLAKMLGLAVAEPDGEAEAFCSYLNISGIVDGVVTDDGDAFLYGAQVVYRGFNLDSKEPTVERYQMSRIKQLLNLDREKLIALALLIGCDYCPGGVPGIGRELALRYLHMLPEDASVLDRLKHLCENRDEDNSCLVLQKKVVHCSLCNHPGTENLHIKSGCEFCGCSRKCVAAASEFSRKCPCDYCNDNNLHILQLEQSIRRKIHSHKLTKWSFPIHGVIEEYLRKRQCPPGFNSNDLCWKCPDLCSTMKFMLEKLEWENPYTVAKVVPFIILWNIRHCVVKNSTPVIKPNRIITERTRNGISCYEVQWKKLACDNVTQEDFYITLEVASVITRSYPCLVASFCEEREKIKNAKAAKKKGGRPERKKRYVPHIDVSFLDTATTENKENVQKLSTDYTLPPAIVVEAQNTGDIEKNTDIAVTPLSAAFVDEIFDISDDDYEQEDNFEVKCTETRDEGMNGEKQSEAFENSLILFSDDDTDFEEVPVRTLLKPPSDLTTAEKCLVERFTKINLSIELDNAKQTLNDKEETTTSVNCTVVTTTQCYDVLEDSPLPLAARVRARLTAQQ